MGNFSLHIYRCARSVSTIWELFRCSPSTLPSVISLVIFFPSSCVLALREYIRIMLTSTVKTRQLSKHFSDGKRLWFYHFENFRNTFNRENETVQMSIRYACACAFSFQPNQIWLLHVFEPSLDCYYIFCAFSHCYSWFCSFIALFPSLFRTLSLARYQRRLLLIHCSYSQLPGTIVQHYWMNVILSAIVFLYIFSMAAA